MATTQTTLRIGIFGPDGSAGHERHGCGLWAAGCSSVLAAAGATPVPLGETARGRAWDDLLEEIDGVVLAPGQSPTPRQAADAEALCRWCEEHELPLLAIDTGLHILNAAWNGTLYTDLPRELPEALQHRHPPERGLRHAIAVIPGTRLAELYGEGEVVVNSEHRRAVQRVGKGFRVGAKALDGVVEAIESENERWFCVGVQWQPASATASGLDIQLFRGLADACQHRLENSLRGSFCPA
jgi:putative glutamine amidotransferase